MSDLSMEWPADQTLNGDLGFDSTGDLLCTDGDTELRQRLTRRLLTNPRTVSSDGLTILPPDDIFNVTYGAGLRRFVGAAVNSAGAAAIKQTCVDSAMAEEQIAQSPPPDATVQALVGGFAVAVQFTSITSGRPVATPRISLS